MPEPAPSFLIVDDHALYRTGLAMALGQVWPGGQVWQAASLLEGLHVLQRASVPPRLILLDVNLPDGDGLLALSDWAQHAPGVPVVLMSSEVDAVRLQRARDAGAAGFVHKSAPSAEIVASLRQALAGQHAYGTLPYDVLTPPKLAAAPCAPRVQDAAAPLQPSPLQVRILGCLGRGVPNKAIARQVGLSEMQVRAEVSWLTEALGAISREEAHQKAVDLGWVSP